MYGQKTFANNKYEHKKRLVLAELITDLCMYVPVALYFIRSNQK